MRKYLVILFLLISTFARAADTNYYVKTGGNDGNTGLSDAQAWLTLTKVNTVWAAGTFAQDDTIFFNRGDTFTGTITVSESGASGHPITISAYGTGADPIITGWTTLASWTDEGGGIYSKTVALASSDYIIVSVDGVNTPIGRWPNAGTWNTIDSYSGKTSLTDAALDDDVIDWDGAEIGVRLKEYKIERLDITSHVDHTLTTTSARYDYSTGWGYFIQNDLATLDATNEWYYDGTDFYIYGDPAAKTVQVSAYVNAVVINSYDYIKFDNLDIQGYGQNGFDLTDAGNIIIQNCSITFCGQNGIDGNNETSGTSYNCIFSGNTISECNDNGIYVDTQFMTLTASSNTISNIGLVPGASFYHGTYWTQQIGIANYGSFSNTGTVIEYNNINKTGYSGIFTMGNDATIRYNLIDSTCLILQDGGGIYTYCESASATESLENYIENNIVTNSIGNYAGTNHTNTWANGIYIDGYSRGVIIDSNVVANSVTYANAGVFFNSGRDCDFTNNIVYNAFYVLYVNEFSTLVDIHENLNIQYNMLIAKAAARRAFIYVSGSGDLSATATTDFNCYARPIDDDYDIRHRSTDYTLTTWKVFRGDDANSYQSPVAVADTAYIDFYYNYSDAAVVQVLPYASIEMDGTKHAVNYSIPAYYGVVLLKDPDPDPDPPDPPAVITSVVTRLPSMRASGGGNCTSDGGGTLSAVGICWNSTGNPTTADSKTNDATSEGAFTSTMTGLAPATTYYIRAYAINETATSYGYEVTYTIGKFGTSGGKVVTSGGKIVVSND